MMKTLEGNVHLVCRLEESVFKAFIMTIINFLRLKPPQVEFKEGPVHITITRDNVVYILRCIKEYEFTSFVNKKIFEAALDVILDIPWRHR